MHYETIPGATLAEFTHHVMQRIARNRGRIPGEHVMHINFVEVNDGHDHYKPYCEGDYGPKDVDLSARNVVWIQVNDRAATVFYNGGKSKDRIAFGTVTAFEDKATGFHFNRKAPEPPMKVVTIFPSSAHQVSTLSGAETDPQHAGQLVRLNTRQAPHA